MSKEWYNMIALRNKGYKSNATFTVEGLSGEDVFEKRVIELLKGSSKALDAGCGDGDFTIKMGQYAKHVVGFDNSEELLKLAEAKLKDKNISNVEFVYGWTKGEKELPFADGEFDLIFCRRGPTSILNHSWLLKPNGIIIGIHSGEQETVLQRIENNHYANATCEVYDEAVAIFPNEEEFIKFLSAFPGNPDYSQPEYAPIIKEIIEKNTVDGRLTYKQWRYVWQAEKL